MSSSVVNQYQYIKSNQELAHACKQFESEQVLAIDTEFMRRNTYFPKLALMQIASAQSVVLIDALAVSDWQPVCRLLVDSKITKLMHACWEDIEVCFHSLKIRPENVIDTQVAAAFAGFDWGMSYHRMVQSLLQLELHKTQTLTNWLQRPLTAKQLNYAVEDVYYLRKCWDVIKQSLLEKQTFDWAVEQSQFLIEKFVQSTNAQNYYKRVKGVAHLSQQQQFVLQALCVWRETKAQHKNLPRAWLVPDSALKDIAKKSPSNEQQLLSCIRKHGKKVEPFVAELLAVLEQCRQIPAEDWPAKIERKCRLPKGHAALAWKDFLVTLAADYNVPVQSLLSKDEFFLMLEQDQQDNFNYRVPHHWPQWKKNVVGEPMLNWLRAL